MPRHPFVPRFFERPGPDDEVGRDYRLVDGSRPEQRERWLEAVYDPGRSLITEYAPATGAPTSSATMPRIVVAMLEALEVGAGHRVLEIGTGSGYGTALLCERLGSDNVTTVEVGAETARLARERLAAAGYQPAVVCGDGLDGHPANAPYDRVISTCQVRRVPPAWVEQARAGSLILATLPGSLLARLEPAGDGSATGPFDRRRFGFMRARPHSPEQPATADLRALASGEGDSRPTRRDLRAMLRGGETPVFWAIARLVLLPFDQMFDLGGGRLGEVDLADGSWARVEQERGMVMQGGPRRLWDELEDLYRHLETLGRPGWDRFGLTVRSDGSQYVWLDGPASGTAWEIG